MSKSEEFKKFILKHYDKPDKPGNPMVWVYNFESMKHAFKAGYEKGKTDTYYEVIFETSKNIGIRRKDTLEDVESFLSCLGDLKWVNIIKNESKEDKNK